jgi:hypothetical protein
VVANSDNSGGGGGGQWRRTRPDWF